MNKPAPNDTIAYLSRHHGDTDLIAERVRRSFARRHDTAFWQFWQQWLLPVCGQPLKILDLGTGQGLFLQALAERHEIQGIGVECAPYMLLHKLRIADCVISEQDLNDPHIDTADNSLDVVMASMVLHELKQPFKVLLESWRCLKVGGRICVIDLVRGRLEDYLKKRYSDANGAFDLSASVTEFGDAFRHFMEHNQYTHEDFVYLLKLCGFKVLHQEAINHGEMVRLVAEKII